VGDVEDNAFLELRAFGLPRHFSENLAFGLPRHFSDNLELLQCPSSFDFFKVFSNSALFPCGGCVHVYWWQAFFLEIQAAGEEGFQLFLVYARLSIGRQHILFH